MKNKELQTIPIEFEIMDKVDDRFTFVKIYLMHLQKNLNNSVFTKDVVEKALWSLENTPILAFIKTDNDGNIDFDGHNSKIVVENGEYKYKYLCNGIGTIGNNCNPKFETKVAPDGTEKEYLTCEGILWTKKFEDVKTIMDKEESFKQSMELDDGFSGFYNPDGSFTFTDFKFYGACLLSNTKHEAMVGAHVEKMFDMDEIRKEIQTNMELLKFSLNKELNNESIQHIVVDESTLEKEGVKNLDEKLKLFENYPNLTIEDLSDYDTYSLEDLDIKLKELSESKNKDFEMSVSQLMETLGKSLRERTVTIDYHGEMMVVSEFYLCDVKDNNAIVIDYEWSTYYGIPFTKNGDSVDLDYDNKTEYVSDWRPKTNSDNQKFVAEDIKERIEKVYEIATNSFKPVETQEYKDLQTQYSTLETEKTEIQTKFDELQSQYTTLETEIQGLQNFKDEKLVAERKASENALFEMFAEKLTEDELKVVKETADKFSIEELETKLKLLVFDKEIKFEMKPKTKVEFSFDKKPEVKRSGRPYDDIMEKYVSDK